MNWGGKSSVAILNYWKDQKHTADGQKYLLQWIWSSTSVADKLRCDMSWVAFFLSYLNNIQSWDYNTNTSVRKVEFLSSLIITDNVICRAVDFCKNFKKRVFVKIVSFIWLKKTSQLQFKKTNRILRTWGFFPNGKKFFNLTFYFPNKSPRDIRCKWT